MSTPPIDAALIRGLVAEVLQRIHAEAAGGQSPMPAGGQTAAGGATPSPGATPPAAAAAAELLADRVVTVSVVERLPVRAGRIAIAARAVVTPAAADRARERGIEFVRAAAAAAAPSRAPLPFFVAHAQCRIDAALRAAAVARAVPGAQRLPATGLAEVIDALAAHAARDGARGLLLTSRPALAVILANRAASLRSVTARDPATLAAAITDCGANLIVADPQGFPAAALERLCLDFATQPAPAPPAELAKPPAGCGCKTHAH